MRRFVADASHELRTPLTSIRGFAELYRQGARASEAICDLMSRIEEEAKRMGLLVEDLLMLARLDQQRPLAQAPVDLLAVAADAVQDQEPSTPPASSDSRSAPPIHRRSSPETSPGCGRCSSTCVGNAAAAHAGRHSDHRTGRDRRTAAPGLPQWCSTVSDRGTGHVASRTLLGCSNGSTAPTSPVAATTAGPDLDCPSSPPS